jgi:predicted PurR-regulated permease PerM
MILYSSGGALLTVYPKFEERIREIYIWIARIFELPYDEHISIFDNIWGQADVRWRVRQMTMSFSNGFIGFLTNAFMVAIFMIFLLFEAVFFKEKLDKAFDGLGAQKIKKISADLMTQVTRYLSIMFFIAVINGVLVGVGLRIIGVEFAAVWGVIQFVMNFIPNIGSIAVGLGATVFSLVQFWPVPGPIIATAAVMLVFNIFCGFVLTPKWIGDGLGLSPLVILLSLLIWGFIWGFAGLIMAVPMMAIIRIVCENIPFLAPISILMGSRKAARAVKIGDENANFDGNGC